MEGVNEILLIEDSPSQALHVQLLLERAGYHVEVVGDGRVGLRVAHAHHPQLILLDIDLPGLDGFQVLSRLKRGRRTADIPVVMLTSREHVSHVERALALGADDYLPKSDLSEQACSVVQQLLSRLLASHPETRHEVKA